MCDAMVSQNPYLKQASFPNSTLWLPQEFKSKVGDLTGRAALTEGKQLEC